MSSLTAVKFAGSEFICALFGLHIACFDCVFIVETRSTSAHEGPTIIRRNFCTNRISHSIFPFDRLSSLKKNETLELFLGMWIDALIIEAKLYYRAVGQLLDDQKFCATTNRKNQVHYRMARYFPSQTPKNPLRAL